MRKLLILHALLAISASTQIRCEAQSSLSEARAEFQLVEENESYRVQRVELDRDSEIGLPQDGRDAIVVILGEGVSMSSLGVANAERLADGDVRFLERSRHAIFLHSGATVGRVLLIGLKQHWDAEIHPCALPKTCSRPIRAGGREIGQSESLFTNGFVTAYRHRMDRGGTLSTSYFSKSGTHHLMLVALDDLRSNFEGTEQELRRGQVFGSDAGEVEIEAAEHQARWVVIRVEPPKG